MSMYAHVGTPLINLGLNLFMFLCNLVVHDKVMYVYREIFELKVQYCREKDIQFVEYLFKDSSVFYKPWL